MMEFTKEQKSVIKDRGHNILVSAAAGSGKTAVLVERILGRICDPKERLDIDRILIMTFTKAAADEMKLRLQKRLLQVLEEHETAGEKDSSFTEHLRRQNTLVRSAYINTIDGICSRFLHDNYNRIDLDPSFRVGSEGELKLIRKEVMEQLLEDEYAGGERSFTDLAEAICTGNTDKNLEKSIEKLFDFSRSKPDPARWLRECVSCFEPDSMEGFLGSKQVRFYYSHARNLIKKAYTFSRRALAYCEMKDGPYVYADVIGSEAEAFEKLLEEWGDGLDIGRIRGLLLSLSFERMPAVKKDMAVDEGKKKAAGDLRTKYKAIVTELLKNYYELDLEEQADTVEKCAPAVKELVRLVLAYSERYKVAKAEKGILDFADLEHLTLEILYEKDENGSLTDDITAVAKTYRSFFEEVYVDEYQDSNEVQEKMLLALSKKQPEKGNLFMVGDVKQSIYKFRMATPSLFIEKNNAYPELEDDSDNDSYENRLITLHRNFRSRKQVIDTVNYIFKRIMIPEVGGVSYDDSVLLIPGAQYPDPDKKTDCNSNDMYKTELLLLQPDDTCDNLEAEAVSIAVRIRELMNELKVKDDLRNEMRSLRYSDIVILFRSTLKYEASFRRVFEKYEIPIFVESKDGFFSGYEIITILDMLYVIDNFRNDEKLCSVMKGYFGGFTDEELSLIRGAHMEGSFSDAVVEYAEIAGLVTDDLLKRRNDTADGYDSYKKKEKAEKQPLPDKNTCGINENSPEKTLKFKLQKLFRLIEKYERFSSYMTVSELITALLEEDDFILSVCSMDSGSVRSANLRMLIDHAAEFEKTSFKGLFNFINYIQLLKKYEVDFGQSSSMSEDDDAVRLMTIHKSKGLEFPVCIVAGMGKKFNLMDSRDSLVMDADMGIGIKYVDPVRRIKKTTVIKEAVSGYIKNESIGEELRILYVALTRAKEKLIMSTCLSKDNLRRLLIAGSEAAGGEDASADPVSFPPDLILGGSSYGDWLTEMLCHDTRFSGLVRSTDLAQAVTECNIIDSDVLRVILTNPEDLVKRQRDVNVDVSARKLEYYERIARGYNSGGRSGSNDNYYNSIFGTEDEDGILRPQSIYVPLKASVSKLKHLAMEENEAYIAARDEVQTYVNHNTHDASGSDEDYVNQRPLPSFIRKERGISDSDTPLIGSLRGTAYHRFFELFDYGRDLSEEGIRQQIADCVKGGFLTGEQAAVLSARTFSIFARSSLGMRMGRAFGNKLLWREQPFCILTDADRVDKRYPKERQILIQGIIDALFMEDGDYIIVDYKTDAVKEADDLVRLYKTQLDYYAEAVEQITQKRVRQKLIYSTKLDCEVPV